jgi:hypothetical protein
MQGVPQAKTRVALNGPAVKCNGQAAQELQINFAAWFCPSSFCATPSAFMAWLLMANCLRFGQSSLKANASVHASLPSVNLKVNEH